METGRSVNGGQYVRAPGDKLKVGCAGNMG